MNGLQNLTVSLTKNGFNKIGDVLTQVPANQLLDNLDGQVNGAHIDSAQVKAMLNFDEATGTFPALWDNIRTLGVDAVQKCVFVAVVFSHRKFIDELSKGKIGEMRGVVRRDDLGDKPYTNLAGFMAKLNMTTLAKGTNELSYNLAPLFTDPTLGPHYKEIVSLKLKECGWPGANDDFTRDFYQQCEEYRLHDVLAISPAQFQDWLEGNVVEVEVPPTVAFSANNAAVTASLLISLATKPFVILAGATGTGKTRSARHLASSIRPTDWSEEFSVAFVPVAAGWTDARHLLGYRSPFGPRGEQYVATALLRLLLRANFADYANVPFFVVLDEMNLSQVEMYFSSFLSLMEVSQAGGREPVLGVQDLEIFLKSRLHDALDATFAEAAIKQGGLFFTKNVFVIGTVNVDDTTHTFSPKVLDRAFVLEYQPPKPSETGAGFSVAADDRATGTVEALSKFILNPPITGDPSVRGTVTAALDELFAKLGRYRFGPRTTNEIVRYVEVAKVAAAEGLCPAVATDIEILDRAIVCKVLTKLQGSRSMLSQPLKDLSEIAMAKGYSNASAKLDAMTRELAGGYANYFSV